jgi:hypothetical protein
MVDLCRVCHGRVSRWDARAWTPLPVVTWFVVVGTWARNVVVLGLVGWFVWKVR